MPQISKQTIKDVIQTLDSYGCGAHHPDLLPLLDQPEGEPVAYRLPDPDVNKKHHYFDLNEVEHVKHVLEALYTSPQPPTAIAKDSQLAALGELVKLSEELGLYASPITGEAP
jgi:hypothetical protein